jgi:hypothetical protein
VRSPAALLRGALSRREPADVLATVDRFDLHGAKVSAVVGVPLRSLQQRRDVAAFVAGAPLGALSAVIEVLAQPLLTRVVEALGDAADEPTYEELRDALEALSGQGVSAVEVATLLAYAVAEAFPAAPHCRRLMEERPEWDVPEVEERSARGVLAEPRAADEEVRERRRARRAANKRPSSPPPPRRPKSSPGPSRPTPPPPPSSADLVRERRPHPLTPVEAMTVDPGHPLAGWVVAVEVPFDAVDPEQPELRAKERPALVVGARGTSLLVRGIYSQKAPGRHLFTPWRRLGLDHPSYLALERVTLEGVDLEALRRLGRVSDEEWNALV